MRDENTAASTAQPLRAREDSSITLSTWEVIAIIFGVLVAVLTLVFAVLYLIKRRRVTAESKQLSAISNRYAFLRKRKTMTPAERLEAEELERDLMIRKSLASRSTINTVPSLESMRSSRFSSDIHPLEAAEHRAAAANSWKELEAQVHIETRPPMPVVLPSGGMHPALVKELDGTPISRPARPPSPSRDFRRPRQVASLPSLPSLA
jgi:hypothetical protein